MSHGSWIFAGAFSGICAFGCAPPPDAGRTRPEAVRTTPFEQRDMQLLGLRVRMIDEGPRDAPVVVLIPGHTSRIEEYDGLVPTLARRHRVLVLDFPGSGFAEKTDRVYSLRLYEDTVLALSGYPLFWPIVWIQSRYWYRADWSGREDALADTFAYYREVMGPGFVRMYFDMAADQVERSLFPLAPKIHHPVWIGWGDQDHGANMGTGVARLAALLPRSELRVFPGVRRSLAAEIPDELAAALEEFLLRPEHALPGGRMPSQADSGPGFAR